MEKKEGCVACGSIQLSPRLPFRVQVFYNENNHTYWYYYYGKWIQLQGKQLEKYTKERKRQLSQHNTYVANQWQTQTDDEDSRVSLSHVTRVQKEKRTIFFRLRNRWNGRPRGRKVAVTVNKTITLRGKKNGTKPTKKR